MENFKGTLRVSVAFSTCTSCGRKKPTVDFYKKRNRRDSRCKECAKTKRRKRYWKNQRRLKALESRHIAKVIVLDNPRTDQQFKRDKEIIKSILAKHLAKLLKEKSHAS